MNTARMGGHPCARARLIREWQDLRAVHDLRASDGESAPWRQDVRAVHSPTALCGAFWIHSTHILPKLAVFEYMQAICCHEPVFFPSEALSGTHRADILPWPAARERIGAQSRHPGTGEVRRGGKRWRAGIPARGSRASPNDELSAPAQRTAAHATAPKAKEGERTARLPLLFCLRLEWPKGLRGNKAPAFGILLGWGFRVRRDCAPRPIR